ncbi:MAG: alanine:cation symporter family protein, partial [Lachnospiraceae bacterium]|nr:alanine:cation symporter family protein [Lachnospiraceae bacterium]
MEQFIERITAVNDAINTFVWVQVGLVLLIGVGVVMTLLTGFFQVTHIKHWMKKTVGGVFDKRSRSNDDKGSVSQFQALCTALAATIGTGNIAGVSAAIVIGGPGAVFWMWIAAFFGMMTNFSENVLGIYYRRKNKEGEWSGGAMYYLKDGLGNIKGYEKIGGVLAVLFSLFAILASFGIGNMGQVNKITANLKSAFFANVNAPVIYGDINAVNLTIGIVLMLIAGVIIIGGLQRIAAVAERVVPFMAVIYVIGALIIFILHIKVVPAMFVAIFKFAFGVKAVGGAATGIMIKTVITQGCKRGVFSNEAGLGSSVMVHSNSNVVEPIKQGLWGIFEVFADTFVVCTMTAVVVLSSGAIDLSTGLAAEGVDDATLVATAFGNVFGRFGQWFVAIAMLLFAFTTVLGWSHYGSKAVEYLFGIKGTKIYRVIFVLMVVSGSLMTSSLAWDISDTFNGLMMIPNLIGVISLSPVVVSILRNYIARRLKNEDIEPIISYDPIIQKEQAER